MNAGLVVVITAVLGACASNPNSASVFGYDDDGTTFAQVAPVLVRGLEPGCWFGEGSAFPAFAYNDKMERKGDANSAVRVYTIDPTSGDGTPLLIVVNFYRNVVTNRMSFSGVVGVPKGEPPNPIVPAVTARVRADYEAYRASGVLPCGGN